MAQQPQPRPQQRPAALATATSRRGIVWTPRLVIWTVILVIVAIFVIANFDSAKLSYLFGEAKAPLALWLLISLAVGYVLGWMRPHIRSRSR